MSQTLTLKVAGLFTNNNEYSEVPQGALSQATNISIDKDSVAESRRGFNSIFNVPGSNADYLFEFENDLMVHYGSSLGYWNGTSLTAFSGTYNHPNSSYTMKSASQNENLYFTTSNGVYKLDVLGNTPVLAGIPAALDTEVTSNTTGGSGFLLTQSSVCYRVVWGFQDANNNLLLGAPSQRASLDNTSTTNSINTNVSFTIPAGITTNYFYQVYRSDQIAFTGSTPNIPDDNMQLVYEGNPTGAQISAKQVTITDITPDSLRGAALYTDSTQQGILNQNTVPPFAIDICSFKNCLWYLNTSTVQNLQFTILAVGGSSGVQLGDTITIAGNTFTAISGSPTAGSNNYQLATSGSPAQNVNSTAINLVQAINQSSTNTNIYAQYLSSSTSLPGQILIQNRLLSGSQFSVTVSAHGSSFNPTLPTSGASVASTNSANLNGLMYSTQQEPEAVPAQNIFYPGSANAPGYRILALRDSMFVLKQDGIFRITGTTPQNFTLDTLDGTVFLSAPNTAVTLNNCIYALTTQGVVTITDTGVSVISRPIEDQLNQIIGTVGAANIAKYAFGVSYESDRKYILFMPQYSSDTSATIAFVYNYFTKAWTTWARSQLAAYVLKSNNTLYVANLTQSVSQERKSYTYTDYVDESLSINLVSYSGTTLNLASVAGINVGDIIYQSSGVNSPVLAVNVGLNQVVVRDTLTWATGSTQQLQSIPCTIQWVPTTGQNPGELKQYSEAILLFKSPQFFYATLGFLSDIVPSFASVAITGYGLLPWGFFAWGSAPWGGQSRPVPIRTYVPMAQQRCTLLTPQFFCQSGWSNFILEGISLQYRTIGSRTSR